MFSEYDDDDHLFETAKCEDFEEMDEEESKSHRAQTSKNSKYILDQPSNEYLNQCK